MRCRIRERARKWEEKELERRTRLSSDVLILIQEKMGEQ